ncbi:MAG: substrate-binding domain-containing protein [Flavobacteriaceae bacterium]
MLRNSIVAWLVGSLALYASAAAAGDLRVVGTGDGLQLLREIASAYTKDTGAAVEVPDSIGSGGGIAAVSSGEERLARVARVLKASEKAAGLDYVPFARIPSAIFANKSAGVTGLTNAQVRDIFEGKVRSWSEVGGNDVKIRVVRREDGDSTLQVLRASMPGWSDLAFTERSKMAVTTQDAVETVQGVEGAVGFAPYSETDIDNVVTLKVDGMAPTDPGYPSAVELAFVFKSDAVEPDMQAFMDFTRSDAGRAIVSAHRALPSS